tara:strand:+ start:1840 stop:3348 length:1509 start_codon:yes stop_codon:yes gene_type:complete
MKWIGQNIYDQISRFRNDVYLESISTGTIASGGNLGLDSNNKIVKANEASGDITGISITTDSGGGVASATQTSGSANFSILGANGVGVTNSSTTITVTSVPGEIDHDSLLNFASNEHFTQANITTVGTIDTGVWNGTEIASVYLDADTAHLTTNQTFSGAKTFARGIIQDGDQSVTPGDGVALHIDSSDITDNNTSASGTATTYTHVNIESPRLFAANASVTTTNAATLYVKGAPATGTNQTITNAWSMWVDDGNARFDGSIYSGTTEAINSSGVVQVAAQTVIDHDQLANFDANEHFTQANITTVGIIGTGEWRGTAINGAYIAGDAINGDKIADNAVDSEHYTDGSIDTAHIADDQVTFAKASGVTSNIFGNTIKLLPSDFVTNDDGGVSKFGIGYVDTAGSTYGMKPTNANTELYAFVSIPEGMDATHVDVYDKNNLGVIVYEVKIDDTTMTSKGTGNCNTTIDITDVTSTATNFLAIQVTTTATSDRVFGGKVTIAAS